MSSNNAVILRKAQTYGPIVNGETMELVKRPYEYNDLQDGDIVIQTMCLSADPYMRGKIRDPSIKSYTPAYEVGKPLAGRGIGRIHKSRNQEWKVGDIVEGYLDWAEYTLMTKASGRTVEHVVNKYNLDPTAYVGVLGMPSFTAYCGLKHIGKPKKGETIFISAAAGAVGQMVGQLCKIDGLRVVGSAGDDEKVEFLLKELNFDAAFNYKKESPKDAVPKLCPDGIDIYWENVGGETLEAALANCNNFARIPACGMISGYGKSDQYGVKNLMMIVSKRIRFEGFIQTDLRPQYWQEFLEEVGKLYSEGKLKYKEHVSHGLENAIDAFIGVLEGGNFGKAMIQVSD